MLPIKTLPQPVCPTIGILGGGQLGRMLALAGIPLGLRFRFLDPSAESPAAHVGELVVGDFRDRSVLERFARGCDAVTLEFENVPVETLRMLEPMVPVFPGPRALEVGQDRLNEKNTFRRLGFDVHEFRAASSRAELLDAAAALGLPCVVKTRTMGYDGKGQAVLRSPEDVDRAWRELGNFPLLIEALVPFEREVSILAVRSASGDVRFWPLVQNMHQHGILRRSIAPAPDVPPELQARAEAHAAALLHHLGYVGVLAIEFFLVRDGHHVRLLANEFAPRVHNSGHWTIEGAVTSQFENHVRAVAGLPLGPCDLRGPSVMFNLIGDAPPTADLLRVPHAHPHLYGKSPRRSRKIGHVTLHGAPWIDLDTSAIALGEMIHRAANG